jgi:hypothetical protein
MKERRGLRGSMPEPTVAGGWVGVAGLEPGRPTTGSAIVVVTITHLYLKYRVLYWPPQSSMENYKQLS